MPDTMSKSFLVLFFKKELLPFHLPMTPRLRRRQHILRRGQRARKAWHACALGRIVRRLGLAMMAQESATRGKHQRIGRIDTVLQCGFRIA
jgi:hypothetical protein